MVQSADSIEKIRIDKWLWQARFCKTRTLAAKLVSAGDLRLNGQRITKPAQSVVPMDVLTFARGDQIRVIRILAIGHKRGPAEEARLLYDDLSEPAAPSQKDASRTAGEGRPTGRERRQIDRMRARSLE